MDAMIDRDVDTADREIVITRLIAAPPELVFEAWTDPEHLAAWWGPDGFTTTTTALDMRPGGVWRFVMHGPDGRDYENRITFEEIVRPGAHRLPPRRRRRCRAGELSTPPSPSRRRTARPG